MGRRYRWYTGRELSDICFKETGDPEDFRQDKWYLVSLEYNWFFKRIIPFVKESVNSYMVTQFERVRYFHDDRGRRIGVFVAAKGMVGWSKVHPKDLKLGQVNWALGKDMAWRRSRDCRLDPVVLFKGLPYGMEASYRYFVDKYLGRYLFYMSKEKQVAQ